MKDSIIDVFEKPIENGWPGGIDREYSVGAVEVPITAALSVFGLFGFLPAALTAGPVQRCSSSDS